MTDSPLFVSGRHNAPSGLSILAEVILWTGEPDVGDLHDRF